MKYSFLLQEQDILELISEEMKEAKKKKEDEDMIETVEETGEILDEPPLEVENLSAELHEPVNDDVIDPEDSAD